MTSFGRDVQTAQWPLEPRDGSQAAAAGRCNIPGHNGGGDSGGAEHPQTEHGAQVIAAGKADREQRRIRLTASVPPAPSGGINDN